MAFRAQILDLSLALLLGLGLILGAQIPGRDPLTPQEADQIRNTAGQLNKRIPLLLQFAQERIVRFEKVRASPRATPGRSARLYALLRQYHEILPELDDAADDLASPPGPGGLKYNVGKVLGKAMQTEQAMFTELQQIQTSSSAADLAAYHFELQNCLDRTRDSLQNAEQDRAGAGQPPLAFAGKKAAA